MENTEQNYTKPLGLDVGASRIVAARNTDKKYHYETREAGGHIEIPPCSR